MDAGKYRKKPVVIDAVQFASPVSATDIIAWVGASGELQADGRLVINTLEGPLTVSPLDFIIKGVKGEFYPCKPDIFEATYEKAD